MIKAEYTVVVRGHEFHVTEKNVRAANGTVYSYLRTKVNVGKNPASGRPRQIDVAGVSLDEIKEKLDRLLHFSLEDANLVSTNVTMDEWYRYGQRFRKHAFEKSTIEREYCSYINHIQFYFGNMKITDIKEPEILSWQEYLLKNGRSEHTVAYALMTLSVYLNLAIKHRYLLYNPCKYCTIVRFRSEKRKLINHGVLKCLLVENANHPYSIFIGVTLLCALRFAEALALSWEDIDFRKRMLTVHQQLERQSGEIKPYTKGKRPRTICLPQSAFWYLEKQKELQEKWERENASFFNEHRLVFTDPNGNFVNRDTVSRWFLHIIREAGSSVVIHDLRRTCVSRAVMIGGDVACAQSYLGHRDMRETFSYLDGGENASANVAAIMNKEMERLLSLAGLCEKYDIGNFYDD